MIIIVCVVVTCFLWALLWHNSSLLFPTVSNGDRSSKTIALTFDDGPDPEITPLILDILDKNSVKATFFCVGHFVEKYPEILRRIIREGHLVANHSYEHTWKMHLWAPPAVQKSIVKSGTSIQKVAGYNPKYYRPPIGIKTPGQALAVWRLGLTFVGWTRWAMDGGLATLTEKKTEKLINDTRNGDIFLLHDGKLNANGQCLDKSAHLAALSRNVPVLISKLRSKGFDFVPLNELLHSEKSIDPLNPENQENLPKTDTKNIIKEVTNLFLHEHSSPLKLSMALALGITIGCSPFLGLHAFIGLAVSIKLRLNKIAVFAGTNITNPITGPFVIFASIQVGWFILNGSWLTLSMEELGEQSLWFRGNQFLFSWLIGFPVVGFLIGGLVTALCYPVLRVIGTRKKEKVS